MANPAPQPDYQRIDQLERELGIGGHAEERGIRPDPVCLVKNCDADTVDLRLWSGQLIRREHRH
jgi:hypothetical protein